MASNLLQQFHELMTAAASELRRTGSGWMELTFGSLIFAGGLYVGWPFYNSYVSNSSFYNALTREMPAWFWGVVWAGVGSYHLFAFVARSRFARFNAAAFGAALLAGTSWMLFVDKVPGPMTPMAPVLSFFEAVSCYVILRRPAREDWLKVANENTAAVNKTVKEVKEACGLTT